jgi:hypothetical protein
MRTRVVLAGAFFATILVCGLAYWGAWYARPDSFIVQQEVNLYPFGTLVGFLWDENLTNLPTQVSGLTEATARASKLIDQGRALRERESQLTAQSQEIETEMKQAYGELERNRAAAIEEFRRRELEALESKRTTLTQQLAMVEEQLNFNFNENRYDPARLVIANLRVELAEHDVQLAQKRVEVAERILKEYGQFVKPADAQRWKELDERATNVRDGLFAVMKERADLRGAAFKLMEELRVERIDRVGFLDFVYFSIGVATGTTFGDIVPNHVFTRSVVALQLLASIIIVGFFVNSLSPR